MQYTKTHDIFISVDQPTRILDTLLVLLQEIRQTHSLKDSHLTPLHAHTILLLDADRQRARYLASLLSSAGYQPCIATTTLEAFTLFLQGAFVPLAITLGQYDPSTRFFLTRLLQQIRQKYRWDPPLITLHTQTSTSSSPNTDRLPSPPAASPEPPPMLLRLPAPTSAPTTSLLPFAPEPSQEAIVQSEEAIQMLVQQATAPNPVLPTGVTDVAPIINISTHDVQSEHNPTRIPLEGLSIGRYHMKTLLGSGPLGQVYQTYDRLREQDVALKAIQMNALPPTMHTPLTEEAHFFQRELDLIGVLDHPHILFPLNCGKSYISGAPFIYKTMTFCPEGSLATMLYQLGPAKLLSPQEVASLVVQIADALQHAHAHSIIYQNFKLSNILLRPREHRSESIHLLLTDFSVAQDTSLQTKTPDMFPYIAPEGWHDQSQPASDQYGLAALAYELLTGRVLFQGHSEHIMRQLHTTMSPQPLVLFTSHISLALNNVVLRALAKKPEERFPSVLHFAEALQQKSR